MEVCVQDDLMKIYDEDRKVEVENIRYFENYEDWVNVIGDEC